MIPNAFRNYARDRRANVAMLFGFLALPLTFALGASVDYGAAARLRTKLNAAADLAALAAVTPAMMKQSDAMAVTAAKNMFNAQVKEDNGLLPRLIFDTTNGPTVTVAHPTPTTRNVTVTYSAQSQNVFGSILSWPTIPFQGSSTANASSNANINFYVLADTSPSMAVAATTDGINKLQAATPNQWGSTGGCAFACHEMNPAGETGARALNNPGGVDNYTLARQLGIKLRIDNVNQAVQSLASTAGTQQIANNAIYNMAIYTFDANFNTITAMATPSAAGVAAQNIQMLEIYQACYLTKTSPCVPAEADTASETALQKIKSIMASPGPGNGTNAPGDRPQEFLFFITDGVENDSAIEGLMQTDMCTTIKNLGIKIGVVYTTYYPIPTYYPYQEYVQPIQSKIGPNLQSCASPPPPNGTYYVEVNTNGDIGAALNTIFASFVQSSHLTQ